MVPNERFKELLNDIEPSSTTKSNASAAHTNLREHLRKHPKYSQRWVHDFLAGSYARDTALRPRSTADGSERPDVDIIVETNHTTSDHPNDVLEELSKALKSAYTVERINKRSVRVTTSYAEMDVVPVISSGSAYLIADRDIGTWRLTNPPGHTAWSTEQNKLFGDRFKPLVKLLKAWRRENPSGKRPKGFVLEVLAARHAPKDEAHFGEAFATMLERMHAEYVLLASLKWKPTIDDPSLPGNDILAKVTVPQWLDFMEKVRVYADVARRAQKTDDMEDATRLWRRVFGERFPKTETVAKAASFTTPVVAPASGFTFPNVPVAPAKPRGFA
jgi:hypothetical protein